MTLPPWTERDGRFPFGKPNTPRPWRWDGAGTPRQLIVGVYPSAQHVSWTPPSFATPGPSARGRIGSMAVDVEPEVFWAGDGGDWLSTWCAEVGFQPGDDEASHGHVRVGTNGPSGLGLHDSYFPALPYSADKTAYLDVCPLFFVKTGSKQRPDGSIQREQGTAIDEDYNPIAAQLRRSGAPMDPATLPVRLSDKDLPRAASARFVNWLKEAIRELRPDHVVTLGDESWATLRLLDQAEVEHPHDSLRSCLPHAYATPGHLRLDGRTMPFTPLAHPGLIRQARASSPWRTAHEAWLQTR